MNKAYPQYTQFIASARLSDSREVARETSQAKISDTRDLEEGR